MENLRQRNAEMEDKIRSDQKAFTEASQENAKRMEKEQNALKRHKELLSAAQSAFERYVEAILWMFVIPMSLLKRYISY